MDAYHLSPDDDRLAELVGRAENGESIAIERDGQVVARLVPVASGALDLAELKRRRAALPSDPVDRVAEMRAQARY